MIKTDIEPDPSLMSNLQFMIVNCDNNDYFTGKTDVKCQDKLAPDHFKTVILNEYHSLIIELSHISSKISAMS